MLSKWIALFLLAPLLTQAAEAPYIPWFSGPLLQPTATNAEPCHPYFEPILQVTDIYGEYNSHWKLKTDSNIIGIIPSIDMGFGFTDRLGIEIFASFITNFQKGRSATHLEDTSLYLGYQLLEEDSCTPNLRLMIQEIFPTGNYQKFHTEIDSTGEGSFQTGPVIAIQKLFPFRNHFVSFQGSLGYLFPTKVHVKGFNTYGGGPRTRGTVHPGQTLFAFLSVEYSLDQHFVINIENAFNYQRTSHFSGKHGSNNPESFQWSLAPEFQYNFSESSGILFGGWFSLLGKNADAFASLFFAYTFSL